MRKQLAIKGHEYRGNEVIEILEMLGASNKKDYTGSYPTTLYILNDNDIDLGYDCDYNNQEIFTLEQFLEKFPFKINDKVTNSNYSGYGFITKMVWDSVDWCVKYCVKFEDFSVIEWFKCNEIKISDIRCHTDCTLYTDLLHKLCENMCENKLSMLMINSEVCNDEVELILDNYEIEVRGDKTFAVKKKPKYPTSYEECCDILGITYDYPDIRMVSTDEYNLYSNFIQLIRCRDAYWKIAGEEMGLGKPWEPDWEKSDSGYVYCIVNKCNNIGVTCEWLKNNYILSFPTAEMRDVFYENFKSLIEDCKQFL